MMPSSPPSMVRKTASMRNCTRISRRRAPSALRTPISRVRSVTEIVMMAITPMPPTIRAIEEMTNSASTTAFVNCRRNATMKSAVTVSKSFSSPSLSRWRARMIDSISLRRSSTFTPSAAETTMVSGRKTMPRNLGVG